MDTEQQVRLDFLEEAEEYFDNLESLLMDLEGQGAEPNLLDTAMRAAHSLKGGAAMMQFSTLSKIAHRLEDFLKILRVRKDDFLVDREVVNLLLKGVDCLRNVRDLRQQKVTPGENWFNVNANPIFDSLRTKLGDLSNEDEDNLLAEEEQIDVSTLLFQSGVEECLEIFEPQIETLELTELKEELGIQIEQMTEFGQMSQIEPFVLLCQSIRQQLDSISFDQVRDLAREALKQWKRSHALVLVGRVDKLPVSITVTFDQSRDASVAKSIQPDINDIIDSAELTAIQQFATQEIEFDIQNNFSPGEFALDATELSDLDEAFSDVELPKANLDSDATANIVDLDEFNLDAAELSDLDEAFVDVDLPEANLDLDANLGVVSLDEFALDAAELSDLDEAFANVVVPEVKTEIFSEQSIEEKSFASSSSFVTASEQPKKEKGRMVRVSAEQLENLNNLSSKLILERNAAILRLNQLQNFVNLTKSRMHNLEQSSNQLRKLYDWASLEGMMPSPTPKPKVATANVAWQSESSSTSTEKFDFLEMDRYTDLHLLSQEQMETIVQLQEVTADMDLGIREMGQVVRDFGYTTHELQQSIARSQMRPFSELVGRFPRLIRDLSSQYDKQVELKIVGETTYIDRQALEFLSDPLTHLLRNAFDHGLEDTQTRIAKGKSEIGQIILRAVQKGNQTIITIADDGGGINPNKIRDRFLKMGFTEAEVANIPEADLLDAIFEPGFSTAKQVTELSGRGVGMDVVRSNLKQIRGDIQVKTEVGQGTTFTISVPLSLLVLRVVIVESAGMVFAVPVNSIKQIIRYDPEIVTHFDQQEQIHWGEQSVSLIRLENHLGFKRPYKPFEMSGTAKINTLTVLIFEDDDRYQGICLEKYWNEQEVAIRPVKTSIPLFPGFSGSTVLGDGRVIPLIEPSAFLSGISSKQVNIVNAFEDIDDISNTIFAVRDTSTIMVVDDSVNVRRYLANILEKNGYKVEEAKDGRDALDKLLGGLRPKAIICDVEMPRLDGYGVLTEAKSEPTLEHIPIAMLTSRSNDKHRKLAMRLGASAYFSKPFNEQEMLQTLASLIIK